MAISKDSLNGLYTKSVEFHKIIYSGVITSGNQLGPENK